MSSCSNAKTGFSFSSSIVAADNLIINAIFKVPRSVRMMFIYPRILTFSIILIFFFARPYQLFIIFICDINYC